MCFEVIIFARGIRALTYIWEGICHTKEIEYYATKNFAQRDFVKFYETSKCEKST